jgi:protein-tyrosine phosphatase
LRRGGASTLISLVESHEFARLGVPDFGERVGATALTWLPLPIPDMGTPDAATRAAWRAHGAALLGALDRGERVLVHCAAGLGRTGMLVARLLAEQGGDADAALAQVRAARPGTVETPTQAEFVRHGQLGGWDR